MSPKLSLICPTIWRSTLKRLCYEVLPQLKEGDEFIIVGDGPPDREFEQPCPTNGTFIVRSLPVRVGDFGCSPCDYGMGVATGDYVFFIGDDDYYLPNAFETIRERVSAIPGVPHTFGVIYMDEIMHGDVIWACKITGQQIIVPRDTKKLPSMAAGVHNGDVSLSDWSFIERVHKAWDMKTEYNPTRLIAVVPTQSRGAMF